MARTRTEAEILLEQQALIRLQEQGIEVVAHRAYSSLPENVREQLAKTMQAQILEVTGAVGSTRDIKHLLETVDPSVSFIRIKKFDIATLKNSAVIETTVVHDTIDNQIKDAIGFSLQDLYQKAALNENKN
jgi:hypothetical protein